MVNKVNKGEWAEFYAFLKILASGKLYAADDEGKKNINKYYSILSAIKKDIEYTRDVNSECITFVINNDDIQVPISNIDAILDQMFKQIKEGKGTFEIPTVEPIINNLHITNIKESSRIKGDINLKVHDSLTGHTPTHSFSVKSYIGGAPTLLNASNGTKFTYEISPTLSENTIDDIKEIFQSRPTGWLDSVIQAIYNNGSQLVYNKISSDVFKKNLQMIDFKLPKILSEVFAHGYLVKNKKLDLSVQSYLKYTQSNDKDLIEYKITEILVASALGMMPMTPWYGFDDANGGYIIVKDNSEVLCYHLYERNELKKYLYNNTRFETASTSRYNTGTIYQENNKQYIDLALQIRFVTS